MVGRKLAIPALQRPLTSTERNRLIRLRKKISNETQLTDPLVIDTHIGLSLEKKGDQLFPKFYYVGEDSELPRLAEYFTGRNGCGNPNPRMEGLPIDSAQGIVQARSITSPIATSPQIVGPDIHSALLESQYEELDESRMDLQERAPPNESVMGIKTQGNINVTIDNQETIGLSPEEIAEMPPEEILYLIMSRTPIEKIRPGIIDRYTAIQDEKMKSRIKRLKPRQIAKCYDSLTYYCQACLGFDPYEWQKKKLIPLLEGKRIKTDEWERENLLLKLARGHGKSYIITFAYATWRITFFPELRFTVATQKKDLGEDYCILAQNNLAKGIIPDTFGRFKPDDWRGLKAEKGKWTTLSFTVLREGNIPGPTYRIISLFATAAGKRADELLMDDPYDELKFLNETTKNKIERWIKGELMNIVEPRKVGGRIIFVTTAKHPEDFSEYLTKHGDFRNIILPAVPDFEGNALEIKEGELFDYRFGYDEQGQSVVEGIDMHGDVPEVLCPERWTFEDLMLRRYQIGGALFDREFQQRHTASTGRLPRIDHLTFDLEAFDWDKAYKEGIFVMGADPALTKNVEADYAAVVLWWISSEGFAYLVDAYAGWPGIVALEGHIAEVYATTRGRIKKENVKIEYTGHTSIIEQSWLNKIANVKHTPISRNVRKYKEDKGYRIEFGLRPWFERQLVRVPQKGQIICGSGRYKIDIYDQIVMESKYFPSSSKDHLLDASELALHDVAPPDPRKALLATGDSDFDKYHKLGQTRRGSGVAGRSRRSF